jgi:integrase
MLACRSFLKRWAGLFSPAPKNTQPAPYNMVTSFELQQFRDGKSEETIHSRIETLRQVEKEVPLTDPELVKAYLARSTWANSTKMKFVNTYAQFLKMFNQTWKPPHYNIPKRLPFIPTEEEIDTLITGTGTTLSAILQLLKETGMRIGELTQLTNESIDYVRKTVNILPEKGSNPRILPLSDKMLTMLRTLPYTHKTLFQPHKNKLRDYLIRQRKRIANQTNNPRILEITFHTFRHWKGTMEYHKTKDIMHVKYVLGHVSINSTIIYINIESAIFKATDDTFTCQIAETDEQIAKLIELGYTKEDEHNGKHFYRKRK